MFIINEDKSIYITRGDVAFFSIKTKTDTGETYKFQAGDVVRFKVFEKKACENVVLSKDFGIEAETEEVGIYLEEKDTKIGDVISKPTDYWYEVELNPYTDPQTIIGYDEDGAKVFKLFPEGNEKEDEEPITPEDIPIVDAELDLTSTRPVQNQAISRAILKINEDVKTQMDALAEDVYDGLADARGRRVVNVAEPEADTDAVTKKYADDINQRIDDLTPEQIGALPLDGSVPMTGNVLNLSEGYGNVYVNPNQTQLNSFSEKAESKNSRMLSLRNSKYVPNVALALRLIDTVDGVATGYDIYGQNNLKRGITMCAVGTTTAAVTEVTFDAPFSTSPIVIVTPNAGMDGNGKDLRVGIVGVSTTKFGISVLGSSATEVPIYWIAVQ